MASSEVVVVGGGAIGGAVAWRLAGHGLRVTLVEQEQPGAGASSAAAGLLLPSAGREGGAPLLALWRASLARYPAFVAALEQETGMPVEFRICGRLMLAFSEDDLAEQERLAALQRGAGIAVERWDAAQVRAAEPAAAPGVLGALYFPEHGLVDNRRLVAALALAAVRRGVRLRTGAPVAGFIVEGDRVRGVDLGGERLEADAVVNAAGCWAGRLDPRFPLPVVPAKGQALALALPPTPFERILSGPDGALSARRDGRILFGSTMEQAGFDRRVTADGVRRLLTASLALVPTLAGATLAETWAGLRPRTPDALPIIGKVTEGLYAATGHFQTGILGTPATADALAGLIATDESPLPLAAFSPARFTR